MNRRRHGRSKSVSRKKLPPAVRITRTVDDESDTPSSAASSGRRPMKRKQSSRSKIRVEHKGKPPLRPKADGLALFDRLIRTESKGTARADWLKEGQSVNVKRGRYVGKTGLIRYVGPVDFARGSWVGIELSSPVGQHDGSVQGTRYFKCKPSHGVFLKAILLAPRLASQKASPHARARIARSSTAMQLMNLPRRRKPAPSPTPPLEDLTESSVSIAAPTPAPPPVVVSPKEKVATWALDRNARVEMDVRALREALHHDGDYSTLDSELPEEIKGSGWVVDTPPSPPAEDAEDDDAGFPPPPPESATPSGSLKRPAATGKAEPAAPSSDGSASNSPKPKKTARFRNTPQLEPEPKEKRNIPKALQGDVPPPPKHDIEEEKKQIEQNKKVVVEALPAINVSKAMSLLGISSNPKRLHRRRKTLSALSDLPLKSLSELKNDGTKDASTEASQKQQEQAKKRDKLRREIIDTEANFVNNMRILLEVFVRPLQNSKLAGKLKIAQPDITTLFSNVEAIANFHQVLLADLYGDDNIGEVFCKNLPHLNVMYINYVNSYSKILTTYQRLKSNKKFAKWLKLKTKETEVKGLGLMSFLVMPVQRIPQYEIMLEKLKSKTPDDLPDAYDIAEAIKILKETAMLNAIKSAAQEQ